MHIHKTETETKKQILLQRHRRTEGHSISIPFVQHYVDVGGNRKESCENDTFVSHFSFPDLRTIGDRKIYM